MNVRFPVIELFDRLAIAEVKWERTKSNQEELNWYANQAEKIDFGLIKPLFESLKEAHNQIWDLEFELKTGVEQNLSLEEIGRRAIKVRDLNAKRISIKNQIAEILECPVREIKRDHLSQ